MFEVMLQPLVVTALLFSSGVHAAGAAADTIAEPVSCPTVTAPLNPLVLKGKRFFDSITGQYVPIKGIAYYPRPNTGSLSRASNNVDFYSDDFRELWQQDIGHMNELGVNLIRIYGVNPTVNHDEFMCTLQNAGIYVMIGLLADCDGCAIGGGDTPAPTCYSSSLKERGQYIINEFSKYTNTIAFSAGNEVTLYARPDIHLNAPCQKKFLSDMRRYVSTCRQVPNTILPRSIPIGMANWDNERDLQTLYFNCRSDDASDSESNLLETPEWYGLNSYQHCDGSATSIKQLTGWKQLKDDFKRYNLSVPVIISEYGCRERGFETIGAFEAQRNWLQVDALYSTEYQDVFAGGIVFEYSAEKIVVETSGQSQPWPFFGFMKLNYGLGYYSPKDCEHVNDKPCEYNRYPEFATLQSKLADIDTSMIPSMDEYNSDDIERQSTPDCPEEIPSILEFEWPTDSVPGLPCYVISTPDPSPTPSTSPTTTPTATRSPSSNPSTSPSVEPSQQPTGGPSNAPTEVPSVLPSDSPTTVHPSMLPTATSSLSTSPPSAATSPLGAVDAKDSSPTTAPLTDTTETEARGDIANDDGNPSKEGNSVVGGSSATSSSVTNFSTMGVWITVMSLTLLWWWHAI